MKKRIVAVLCIGMISATMVIAGCSSSEQEKETTKETDRADDVSDKTEEESSETATQNQTSDIVGEWTIDRDKTDANNANPVSIEFGSGISEGDNITFNVDGTFSWYVGVGNGGKGTYVEENGKISGNYTKDSTGSQDDISMTFSDGEIVMNIWKDDTYFVYWKRK